MAITPQEVVQKYGKGFFFKSDLGDYLYAHSEGHVCLMDGTNWRTFVDPKRVYESNWTYLDIKLDAVDSIIWYGTKKDDDGCTVPSKIGEAFETLRSLAVETQTDIMFTNDGDIHMNCDDDERQITVSDFDAVEKFLEIRKTYVIARDSLGRWS